MWLLGFELWTFGRAVGCSYPLSHLTSPCMFILFCFSESGFFCRVLAILELSFCRPGWPQTQTSTCLCLLSAGIKVMCHYHLATAHIQYTQDRLEDRSHLAIYPLPTHASIYRPSTNVYFKYFSLQFAQNSFKSQMAQKQWYPLQIINAEHILKSKHNIQNCY